MAVSYVLTGTDIWWGEVNLLVSNILRPSILSEQLEFI